MTYNDIPAPCWVQNKAYKTVFWVKPITWTLFDKTYPGLAFYGKNSVLSSWQCFVGNNCDYLEICPVPKDTTQYCL